MADDRLRRELIALGYTPGPITDSTRRVLEKKLDKLRAQAKDTRSRRREPRDDSDDRGTSERRSQGQYQPPPEGAPWTDKGAQQEEDRSWRQYGSSRYSQEDSCQGRETTHLPGDNPGRSSLGQNRYAGDNPGRSSLGQTMYAGDNPGRSSLSHYRYSDDSPERSSLGQTKYAGDIPGRSSLGQTMYAGDSHGRSSLGQTMYAGDNPGRSSLGQTMYAGDNPGRSSLGQTMYAGDNPGRSSLGQTMYAGDNPRRSSLGQTMYAGDKPGRSSLGYYRYSGDDSEKSVLNQPKSWGESPLRSSLTHDRPSGEALRYRLAGALGTTGVSRTTATDSLTLPGRQQQKVSWLKPGWSKKLEHHLSQLLPVLCVLVLLVFAGILIVKCGVLTTSQDGDGAGHMIPDSSWLDPSDLAEQQGVVGLLPSDCDGRKDSFCEAKQKEITLQILSELYEFLSLEAGNFECGNPSGLTSRCVPFNQAKEYVTNVTGNSAEKFDAAMDWMLSSERHLGIWAKGEDAEDLVTARTDIFCVESSRPRLGFVCRLKNALYTAISNLFLALIGIFILWIILILLRYHWQRLEEEEKQMFAMVEKIIDVLKHHYKDWTLRKVQSPHVGILHVRDSLIMPQDRKRLKAAWDRAVEFVENNESRVRTELQRVAGADLRVWRWTHERHEHPR